MKLSKHYKDKTFKIKGFILTKWKTLEASFVNKVITLRNIYSGKKFGMTKENIILSI